MIGYMAALLFVFATAFFIFFVYSLSKQRNALSAPFSIMCLAAAIYIAGYGFELLSPDKNTLLFALKIEYLGIPFMPAFWLFFAYKFQFKKKVPFSTSLILLIIPVLTMFFALTNEFHGLIYKDILPKSVNGYLILHFTKGFWYNIYIFYSYIAQIFGLIVFYNTWKSNQFKFSSPGFMLFLASLSTGVFNLIYLLGLSPYNLDLTPFGLCISATLLYIAIFKLNLLELTEFVKDIAFMEITEGIIVLDTSNRLIDFNRAAQYVFPWLNKNLIGTDFNRNDEGAMLVAKKTNIFELEVLYDDTIKFFEFKKIFIEEKNKIIGKVYFIQDITQQKQLIENLNNIASYDYLTKIYNRRSLLEAGDKALIKSRSAGYPFTLLMLDIDHFKHINDKYGHLAGDEVLKALANACRSKIRCTDIIGRFGGEEFLIILPDADGDNAYHVALGIKDFIEHLNIQVNAQIINITVSIGMITLSPSDSSRSLYELIDLADMALYKAKNSGRNNVMPY